MTPQAIQSISRLREEFYHAFAVSLAVPVRIFKGAAYCASSAKVSWVDDNQRLNYLCVYAHLAPDMLIPERPLILRIGVNQGVSLDQMITRRKAQQQNSGLSFHLTLLPDEMMAFIPWIVELVMNPRTSSPLPLPPHELNYNTLHELKTYGVWTHNASHCLLRQSLSQREQLYLEPPKLSVPGIWR